jgi:hypothetical protein
MGQVREGHHRHVQDRGAIVLMLFVMAMAMVEPVSYLGSTLWNCNTRCINTIERTIAFLTCVYVVVVVHVRFCMRVVNGHMCRAWVRCE